MPEGPEIRRSADRLQRALRGERLTDVRFELDRLRDDAEQLIGTEVLQVTSRGKALLTYFSDGHVLYSHNQLYGRWTVCRAGKAPATNRSLRVALETSSHWALLYSASEIELLDADSLEEHPFLAKLGPDLLDRSTTVARIERQLADPRFARRSLGALLLDQSFLAGVGNYLRSEILFFSGLDPARTLGSLDADELALLARVAKDVTRRSYRTAGLSEEPDFVARAKADGEPRGSYRHAVFGRAGAACRRCGGKILRAEIAGRRLYVCRRCQPVRNRRRPRSRADLRS